MTDPHALLARLDTGIPQTVVVYGTSLTAEGAWVSHLREALDHRYPGLVTLHNSGGSGRESIWGLENLEERVIAKSPDWVFLEFAINDSVTRFSIPVESARANLETMIDRIQAAHPACGIILMTMTPGDLHPEGHRSHRSNLPGHYAMVRAVAAARGLALIDHDPNWKRLQAEDLERFTTLVPDHIHPTVDGCSDVVTPEIFRALGLTTQPE